MIRFTRTELQWLWNAVESKKDQLSAMIEEGSEAEALLRHHIASLGLVQDKIRAVCDSGAKRVEINF